MNSTTSSGARTRRPRTGLSGLVTGLALLALSFIVGFVLIPSVAAHATTTPSAVGAAASPVAVAIPRPAASMPLVIAHRGDSAVAPENTIPAMLAAARANADMVEFDVQRASDGHLIVLLELKNPGLYPGYEAQVARELGRSGFAGSHRINVHSFSETALASFHRLDPSVPVGLITEHGTSGTSAAVADDGQPDHRVDDGSGGGRAPSTSAYNRLSE